MANAFCRHCACCLLGLLHCKAGVGSVKPDCDETGFRFSAIYMRKGMSLMTFQGSSRVLARHSGSQPCQAGSLLPNGWSPETAVHEVHIIMLQ